MMKTISLPMIFSRKITLVFTVIFAFAVVLLPILPSPMGWVG
jgi:hypothetical protein